MPRSPVQRVSGSPGIPAVGVSTRAGSPGALVTTAAAQAGLPGPGESRLVEPLVTGDTAQLACPGWEKVWDLPVSGYRGLATGRG